MKRSILIALITAGLLVTLLTACAVTPEAVNEKAADVEGPAVRMTISPDTFKVGETAEINVLVQDVADLAGVDIQLVFDSTAIEVLDADPETGGTQTQITDYVTPDFVAFNTAETGEVHVVYASATPADSPEGTLFTFTVKALSKGQTTVRFAQVKLAAEGGIPVDVTAINLALQVK